MSPFHLNVPFIQTRAADKQGFKSGDVIALLAEVVPQTTHVRFETFST